MPGLDVDDDLIRRLAGLLDETGLAEIEVEDGGKRIRVARAGGGAVPVVAAAPVPVASPAMPAPTALDAAHPGAVTSPMVGTAYLAPEPDAAPFVAVGDRVEKGDTLLIIEAMKVLNRIPAPRAGTVRRILVANQAPVEYGEALMVVE